MSSPGPKFIIKMSLSVQHLIVESFKFNDKHGRSVYVKDVGQCLVSKDVYEAIGYEKKMEPKQCSSLFLRDIRLDLATPRWTWRVWTEWSKHHITERT